MCCAMPCCVLLPPGLNHSHTILTTRLLQDYIISTAGTSGMSSSSSISSNSSNRSSN